MIIRYNRKKKYISLLHWVDMYIIDDADYCAGYSVNLEIVPIEIRRETYSHLTINRRFRHTMYHLRRADGYGRSITYSRATLRKIKVIRLEAFLSLKALFNKCKCLNSKERLYRRIPVRMD